MKNFWMHSVLAASVMLAFLGCAHPPELVLTQVGPEKNSTPPPPSNGNLIVFSALDTLSTRDTEHINHRNYDIYSQAGNRIKHVVNYFSPVLEEPLTVPLPPGSYIVKAPANRFGTVTVPVVIERNKLTVVRLDGSRPPAAEYADHAEFVYLPDGSPIGWRSTHE